jgi:hypothetical protein
MIASRNRMRFPLARPAMASLVTAIILAAIGLAPTRPALAEAVRPSKCEPNSGVAANLELLRGADSDKTRAVAASALVNDWPNSLPTVMRELTKFSGPADGWAPNQQSYFLSITDVLRTVLSTNVDAITLFRVCHDTATIKPLISAARADTQPLRLNATLILGNIVDNTSVCFVLHQLRDPKINVNGRANLLGVTYAVASYAYSDNVKAINDTLDVLRPRIEANATQTLKLISDITSRVNASSNKSATLADAGLKEPCTGYDYNAKLE